MGPIMMGECNTKVEATWPEGVGAPGQGIFLLVGPEFLFGGLGPES